MVTLGVEMEFKTSPCGLERCIQARNSGEFGDLPYSITCDHAQLIEIKTPITRVEDGDFDRDVVEMRTRFAEKLNSAGIPFTYYGVHMSIWNFSKPEMKPIGELCGDPPWALIVGYLSTHPRNVYRDPFIDSGPPVHHSIFICDHMEAMSLQGDVFKEEVDAISWQRRRRIFHLVPDLKDILNYGPVPGGAIRVQRANRLELILGWLPTHIERRLFDALIAACVEDGPVDDPDKDSIVLVAKRGNQKPRLATAYLSGYTYKKQANRHSFPENISGNYIKVFEKL